MFLLVTYIRESSNDSLSPILSLYLNKNSNESWSGFLKDNKVEHLKDLIRKNLLNNESILIQEVLESQNSVILELGDRFYAGRYVGTRTNLSQRQFDKDERKEMIYHSLINVIKLSALFHDAGKASSLFQRYLNDEVPHDMIRHEIISSFLFNHYVSNGNIPSSLSLKDPSRMNFPSNPNYPLVLDLIACHHKIPFSSNCDVSNAYGFYYKRTIKDHLKSEYLPLYNSEINVNSFDNRWHTRVKKAFKSIEDNAISIPFSYAFILSMTVLKIADHIVSIKNTDGNTRNSHSPSIAFANTFHDKESKEKIFGETLRNHLLQVDDKISSVLKSVLYTKWSYYVSLKHRESSNKRFFWQTRSVRAVEAVGVMKDDLGFVVNIASTGSGKTLANIMVARKLSENELRVSLLLGRKDLTEQSGKALSKDIDIAIDDISILVSGGFKDGNYFNEDDNVYSVEDWYKKIPTNLKTIIKTKVQAAKIASPLLVATIDHMISVSSMTKSNHLYDLIRLMTSTLIVDEIDDLSECSAASIQRLIYLSALFGQKCIISSATMPPELIEANYLAYKKGAEEHLSVFPSKKLYVGVVGDGDGAISIAKSDFNVSSDLILLNNGLANQAKHAKENDKKRMYGVIKTEKGSWLKTQLLVAEKIKDDFANHKLEHEGIGISFAIARFALVDSCHDFIVTLNNSDFEKHGILLKSELYTSRLSKEKRQYVEENMFALFNRKNDDWRSNKYFLKAFNQAKASGLKNVLFVIVASPVIDTGKDISARYGFAEPVTLTADIQLNGRIIRHEEYTPSTPNFWVMDRSVRELKGIDKLCYYGFPGPGVEKNELTWRLTQPAYYAFGYDKLDGTNPNASIKLLPPVYEADILERRKIVDYMLIKDSWGDRFIKDNNPFIHSNHAECGFREGAEETCSILVQGGKITLMEEELNEYMDQISIGDGVNVCSIFDDFSGESLNYTPSIRMLKKGYKLLLDDFFGWVYMKE
jgi:CRISPR-associated endonuclease/helicase Cas3